MTRRLVLVLALLLASSALRFGSGLALGDVIVLKGGRKIQGKIIQERDDAVVVQITSTIRMTVYRRQIKSITKSEYKVPGRTPHAPSQPAPAKAKGEPEEEKSKRTVCFLQVTGPLEADLTVTGVKRAIQQAKRRKADLLVVELDTPGGRMDLMEQICTYLEKSEMETVAYVVMGKSRGAFSAGAIIALACDRIVMAPGTSFGAATPYVRDLLGSPKVTEKMVSAFSAVARSIASRHKHPPLIASALVDADVEIREVKHEGQVLYVEPERAEELAKKGASLGRWLSRRGKLLTMTADEAKASGLIVGTASSRREMLELLGITSARMYDLKSGEAVAKAISRRKEHLEKLEGRITAARSKAESMNPSRFTYSVYTGGRFADRGKAWRKRTDTCVRAYDICLKLCKERLALARKSSDLAREAEAIKAFMIRIKTTRDAVAADRNRDGLAE